MLFWQKYNGGMKKLIDYFKKIKNSKQYFELKKIIHLDGISKFAPAASSFYLILSLIPCLVLIELILSFINLSLNQSFSFFSFLFPDNQIISDAIEEIIDSLNKNDLFSAIFSLSIVIYLSSKGTDFFIEQNNRLYFANIHDKSFIKRKIKSMIITLTLIMLLCIFMVFLVIFDNYIHIKNYYFLTFLKYLYVLLMIYVYLIFFYILTNRHQKKIRYHLIGGLIATIGIGIGVFIYYLYIVYISSSLTYYGPLSLIAILFLISYYTSYLIFIGIKINYFISNISFKYHNIK